jgi:hypothetical protein
MAIHVEITAGDIQAGVRLSIWRDALCLALHRITGRKWLTDGCSVLCVVTGEELNLPFAARDFVRRFDANENPGPVSFEIGQAASQSAP